MYEVDERDRVVELADVPQSCAGAPDPCVLADERQVLLSYRAPLDWAAGESGGPSSIPASPPDRTVIVRFKGPYAHIFGPPNDEAIEGHPLFSRGLRCYSAFEVVDSSWIRKLERMNSIHSAHDRARFMEGKRHFILTFHDTMFEAVANGYASEIMDRGFGSALDRMCGLIMGE